jgi:Zn-dependent protease with chaperone function
VGAFERRRFPEIAPQAWEHPADRAALNSLRRVPGVDAVVKTVLGATGERSLRLLHLASAVRVSARQFPRVHAAAEEMNAVLGVEPERAPEIFVSRSPFLNASAIGWERPFIVLASSAAEELGDGDELAAIYAHELGHILSGHTLYKTALSLLAQVSSLALSLPLGGAAVAAATLALREWDRKSELSADRASLLATQDLAVQHRLLMKAAGGGLVAEMDLEEFRRQAAEYEEASKLSDQVLKLYNLLGQSHPFAVLRVVELTKWSDGDDYARVLAGDYPRGKASGELRSDLAAAGDSYADGWAQARDSVAEAVGGATRKAQAVAEDAATAVRDFFAKK